MNTSNRKILVLPFFLLLLLLVFILQPVVTTLTNCSISSHSIMSKKNASNDYIPLDAKLQKELQCAAAIVCYNFICTGSKGMMLSDQSTKFHGDGNIVPSQARNLASDQMIFVHAFEEETVVISDKNDQHDALKKLKTVLTCKPNSHTFATKTSHMSIFP